MSIYDDDGFDEEAAELSEAITGSYTPAGQPGGQAQGFTFDDGGDNGVNYTLGKSDPRGGTQIQGNVIRGGKIFGRTQSQLDRQQRLAGMGDYRNSQQYKDYLTATGRSLKNPFGNTGILANVFGADKVSLFNPDDPRQRQQAQNLLDIGFDRYMNFDQQTPEAQRRGFGKLFGGPEGEMTVEGELRAQVPEMTTAESLFRSVIPGASFLPNPGTTYAPMGTVDFQPNPGYDPERDPRANQDLRSGPFSLLTDALSKGRDFIASKLSPAEELAAQTKAQARGSELSQTVSGGRFEDESARPQVMTPDQEFLTFDGRIQDSVRQSQELSPQLDTISGGGRPKVNFSTAQPTLKETMSNLRRGQQEGRIPTQSPLGSFTSAAPGEYNPLARGDFLGDPTYPGGTNYGKRTDPEKRTDPLMVDFLNSIDLNKIGDLVNTVRSGPPSVQTPFGELSLEPQFDGVRPVGAMLRLKGTF
tara:strand:+ start:369 stop:1787 length:1419 start_codon:yes stop_codon:yes gene_type:complete